MLEDENAQPCCGGGTRGWREDGSVTICIGGRISRDEGRWYEEIKSLCIH
jgi:hypothetical protein